MTKNFFALISAVLLLALFAACSRVPDIRGGGIVNETSAAEETLPSDAPEEKNEAEIYSEAKKAFAGGDYETAKELFVSLGDYSDSDIWLSDTAIVLKALGEIRSSNYDSAADRLLGLQLAGDDLNIKDMYFRACAKDHSRSGNYTIALNYLYEIANGTYIHGTGTEVDDETAYSYCIENGDKEVKEIAELCMNGKNYDEAQRLFDSGKYSEAKVAFEKLGDYIDSASMAQIAADNIQNYDAEYAKAEEYFNNGNYYKAYAAYAAIYGYQDSAKKSEACKQTMPSNGSHSYSAGSRNALTISAPSGTESVYVKMYSSGGNLAATVFLSPGGSSTVYVDNGTYVINVGYGTTWWGDKDLFGDNGYYCQLTDGNGSSNFSLSDGDYELQLQVSAGGNVGSKSIGKGNF